MVPPLAFTPYHDNSYVAFGAHKKRKRNENIWMGRGKCGKDENPGGADRVDKRDEQEGKSAPMSNMYKRSPELNLKPNEAGQSGAHTEQEI